MPRYSLHRIEPYSRRAERFEATYLAIALRYAQGVAADLAANGVQSGDRLTTFRYRIDDAAGQPLVDLEVSITVQVRRRDEGSREP